MCSVTFETRIHINHFQLHSCRQFKVDNLQNANIYYSFASHIVLKIDNKSIISPELNLPVPEEQNAVHSLFQILCFICNICLVETVFFKCSLEKDAKVSKLFIILKFATLIQEHYRQKILTTSSKETCLTKVQERCV